MSSKKKKTPKDPKDKAAAPPLDSLQRSLQEPAAEDGDDDGLDQVSNAASGPAFKMAYLRYI